VCLQASEALAADGVEVDHVKIWQTVGKLRRRHGLLMSGEPREPGYRVEDWTWEAKRGEEYGAGRLRRERQRRKCCTQS